MAEAFSTRDAVIRNLKDAGCTEEFVARFLNAMEKGTKERQLCLLCGQRRLLLESLHREQGKLDCLDFFIYHLKKAAKAAEGKKP